MFAEERGPCCW